MRSPLNDFYEKRYPYQISDKKVRRIFKQENHYSGRILFLLFVFVVSIVIWAYLLQIDRLSFLAPQDYNLHLALNDIANDQLGIMGRFKAVFTSAKQIFILFYRYLLSLFF